MFATTVGTPLHAATVTPGVQEGPRSRPGCRTAGSMTCVMPTATFLLAQGMGLEDVKNLLGHSSITLTSNTYGHVLEAAAAGGGAGDGRGAGRVGPALGVGRWQDRMGLTGPG